MSTTTTTTSWDRAAPQYLAEWVPRFLPYHRDLIEELAVSEAQKVLVVSAGPGAEALVAARRVGPHGKVVATDSSPEMVRICGEEARRAGVDITTRVADFADASGGPWDAIVCAFGLWQIDDARRPEVLAAWRASLAPHGKVGVVTWGPPDPDGPFERLAHVLQELEPGYAPSGRRKFAERELMAKMFEEAGLAMVRCTVIRHPNTFERAEDFVRSLQEACTWRRIWEDLGDERINRIAAKFYEGVGGPEAPLSFAPAATLAIAALPGAQVEIAARPSVRAPDLG